MTSLEDAEPEHYIERVWGGLRVTLTYLLRRSPGSVPLPVVDRAALATLVQDKLRVLLRRSPRPAQGRDARLSLLPPLSPGRPLPAPAATALPSDRYGTLHVEVPPYGEGSRVVGKVESPLVPASSPRQRSARQERG